jgi:hypothetical protein
MLCPQTRPCSPQKYSRTHGFVVRDHQQQSSPCSWKLHKSGWWFALHNSTAGRIHQPGARDVVLAVMSPQNINVLSCACCR